ncbi:MAG: hypothetical protein IKH99_01595, partial [Prevotella sp.]|nr:hypothetical protein [Prevotella sp.]
ATGRFYVDFYRGPYYDGDNWEATVKAKKRKGGYIEFVKEDSQKELENKIDEAREPRGQVHDSSTQNIDFPNN